MKLINRDTDYAVKALMNIAKNSERMSVSELVPKLNIPRPFLRKILQTLNKKGILESYKGKNGGFCLAVSPDQIFLTDLIRIFQGPVKIKDCIFNRNICPDIKTCPLKKKLDEIEKHVISELQSITLAILLEEGREIAGVSGKSHLGRSQRRGETGISESLDGKGETDAGGEKGHKQLAKT